MRNRYLCYMDTPVGTVVIKETDGAITMLSINRSVEKSDTDSFTAADTPLLQEAKRQLSEYFAGKRKQFDLPVRPQGTAFQQKVWGALRQIPYGETRSYGEVAAAVGNPKASRAVGGANHQNPIMIVIPCHRVIGADGSLTGFGGGLWVKEYLLSLEKKHSSIE